ncbi:hypothetical protein T440DRAFT_394538, partial [Plenodomus tracheiphilus IPT5]
APWPPPAPALFAHQEGTDHDSPTHQMLCFMALIAGEDGVGHMCDIDRLGGVGDRQGWLGS